MYTILYSLTYHYIKNWTKKDDNWIFRFNDGRTQLRYDGKQVIFAHPKDVLSEACKADYYDVRIKKLLERAKTLWKDVLWLK